MDNGTFTGWRKSSRSTGNPNNCVEVAAASDLRAVRDSKAPHGPRLVFSSTRFANFLRGVQEDR